MNIRSLFPFAAMMVLAGCDSGGAPGTPPSATGDATIEAAADIGSGEPPQMSGDPSRNPDMMEFAAQVDTDHDGRMSKIEWDAQGLPQSSFNMLEKGRGYVTLEDYQMIAAPPGIDINGDGKLTIAEFREFDRKMSARMAKSPPPSN